MAVIKSWSLLNLAKNFKLSYLIKFNEVFLFKLLKTQLRNSLRLFLTPQVKVLTQKYFSSLNLHSINKKLPNYCGCFNTVNVSIFHKNGIARSDLQYFGHLTYPTFRPPAPSPLLPFRSFFTANIFCICPLNIAISCIGQLFFWLSVPNSGFDLHIFLGQISVHIPDRIPCDCVVRRINLIYFLRRITNEKIGCRNLPKCQFSMPLFLNMPFLCHI